LDRFVRTAEAAENLKGKTAYQAYSERKIILKWIFWKYNVRVWTGFIWLGIGTIARLL
jgi:hypothetical protein